VHQDLSRDELNRYTSALVEPADFDDFWARTLAMAAKHDASPQVIAVSTPLVTVEVGDVTFHGFGGHPIRAWFRRPLGVREPLPLVVSFVGYGGGRGHWAENLLWSSAGYAHLHVDTRGQGAGWSRGDTPDPEGSGPRAPGVMTQGIEHPENYYYRRFLTDAVRAVDAGRQLPGVDPDRVAVVGQSQGGAAALAVAGLRPDIAAVVALVPFLCDIPRAIVITDDHPFREVADYLAVHRTRADAVLNTLGYVDGVAFARRATAPAYFSAALMDTITPPSTVFAAHNAYAGRKEMSVWPYNGHEAGGPDDDAAALEFLDRILRPGSAPPSKDAE
jgi:cephalosporin-C deacetylase